MTKAENKKNIFAYKRCKLIQVKLFAAYIIVVDNKNTATQFLHYLNNCHENIKLTVEFEENNTIPFLDILIKRYNHTFSTSINRKKTFTGLYTKWDSFTPRKYKVNLIRTLTFRCFRICWSPSLLRSCLDELRKLLLQNGYPSGVNNYNINDVLNRQQNRPRNPTTTVPKNRSAMRTCVAYELPWSQRFFLPLRGSGSLILCREKSRKSSVTGVLNSPFFTYHWNPVDSVTKI